MNVIPGALGSFLTGIGHPYETFKARGYDVDIVGIAGGEAPLDGMHEKDEPLNVAFLNGDGLEKMKHTRALTDVTSGSYDAVFIPGGLAPMVDMPQNTALQALIAKMHEGGKVIGAVCHGPVSLLNVKFGDGSYLIDGKNLTSFSNEEEDHCAKTDVPFLLETALRGHAAQYSAAAPWVEHVITDARLVTGQNPASANGVAEEMIRVLEEAKS